MIKNATTLYPLHPVIKNRWSARAFAGRALSPEALNTLLEAASWAPSAMNEQPWRYVAALKQHDAGFGKLLSILNPANASWAKGAAALLLSYTKTQSASGAPNTSAMHDTGMANQNILLQGMSMDIYGHVMGGFDRQKARELFGLGEGEEPVCVIALGYLGNPENLEEPFLTRETTPRSRKALADFVIYEN